MPDYGTARCDFPKGSAAVLFDSVKTLYTLPDQMRMFLCHDYLPESRDQYQYETSVYSQKHKTFISILQRKGSILSRCETAVMQC